MKAVETKPSESLRLVRVAVEGLFGLYNHDISLCASDRVTILHGPNGVGKTALLKLIASVFSGRYVEFIKYPFDKFQVDFNDGSSLTVKPYSKTDEKQNQKEIGLDIILESPAMGSRNARITLDSPEIINLAIRLAAIEPDLRRISENMWSNRLTREELSPHDILIRYSDDVIPFGSLKPMLKPEPSWLSGFRKRIHVHVIETQRLFRVNLTESFQRSNKETLFFSTVSDCARDLSVRIRDTLAQYGTESQQLDQSFPQRLLKAVAASSPAPMDLKAKMTNLGHLRTELQKIGLLDSTSSDPFDIQTLDELSQEQGAVMSLYINDTQQKLAVLEPLAKRITLFLDKINSKFKHKQIHVDRDKGFVALGHTANALDLDVLSSGEQHQLVLLYDLLFRVQPNTLVLIDEPELSLHLTWQKQFLPDLLEIVQAVGLDILMATHSPFIVSDRDDLMVALASDINK